MSQPTVTFDMFGVRISPRAFEPLRAEPSYSQVKPINEEIYCISHSMSLMGVLDDTQRIVIL